MLGIQKSEEKHVPIFGWSEKSDAVTSCYGGKDNINMPISNCSKQKLNTHWRDSAKSTGVVFNIPEKFIQKDIFKTPS